MSYLERRTNPDELSPEELEQRRVERRRNRRRRKIIRDVAIGGTLLFVAILILALRFNFSWVVNQKEEVTREQENMAAAPKPMPRAGTDLVMQEAGIQGTGTERRIAGVIHNKSNHAYAGVQVSLFVRSGMGEGLGYVRALIAQVGPSADVKFETDTLPAGGVRYEFYAITGTVVP